MSDRRPDRVYGILVRDEQVFLAHHGGGLALPGGDFRPLAEDRKVELKAHLFDQLGIEASAIWAQGGFMYQRPGEQDQHFAGFYSVWEWEGDIPIDKGRWVTEAELMGVNVPPSLRILLVSILNTKALRTR
ncbi:hypothetical protein AYO38_09010 [bacterium SCGC AG-212-C10]|nr:hypothetical protein AYO38_09010 [bacterium SCGC AG-212-C10]